MNPPVFLLGAVILFWGWQNAQWWIALPLAAMFEAARRLPLRFQISAVDLTRLANFCSLLLVAISAYFAYADGAAQAIVGTIKWLPLALSPLFLAIAYGGRSVLDLSVISTSMRRRETANRSPARTADLGYPYLGLWILAASVANRPGMDFYIGISVFCAWILWRLRPKGHSPLLWAALLALALIGGSAISSGLHNLQNALEQIAMDWLLGDGDEDPERSRTNLGHIGQLKLSDAIALHVTPLDKARPRLPLLLRTASYDTYLAPSWVVGGERNFTALPRKLRPPGWWLGARTAIGASADDMRPPPNTPALEISTSAPRSSAIIALPDNALTVEAEIFTRLDRNLLGTVQAELPGGHYSYRIGYDPELLDRSLPSANELRLPTAESKVVLELARQLQLRDLAPELALRKIKAYFNQNFSYSTYRSSNAPGRTAMADFLLNHHSGHCEHFASASVLLLRAAGIPARYAVGFSVQESNPFGNGYIARQRHAHAWARAYVNGAWRDFDATPPVWSALEQDSAPFWQPLMDGWTWLVFYARQVELSFDHPLVLLLGLIVLVWLARKAFMGGGALRVSVRRLTKAGVVATKQGQAETDSEFYQIEQFCARHGMARPKGESLNAWLARIGPQMQAHWGPQAGPALREIVELHYNHRFGPLPLADGARQRLRDASGAWMARFAGVA